MRKTFEKRGGGKTGNDNEMEEENIFLPDIIIFPHPFQPIPFLQELLKILSVLCQQVKVKAPPTQVSHLRKENRCQPDRPGRRKWKEFLSVRTDWPARSAWTRSSWLLARSCIWTPRDIPRTEDNRLQPWCPFLKIWGKKQKFYSNIIYESSKVSIKKKM